MKTPEEIKATAKAWRQANKERLRVNNQRWSNSNPGRRAYLHRRWVNNNPDKWKVFREKYNQKPGTQKIRIDSNRRWRQENPDLHNAQRRRYAKRHPAQRLAKDARRRAVKRGVTVRKKCVTEFLKQVKSGKTAICYYCQRRVSSKKVHVDHIVALANGGPHSIENLCVSCAPCNLRKSDKSISELTFIPQILLCL